MPTVIHPTAVIEEGVELGADCEVRAGAILRRGTILGDRVIVHSYAVLGGEPQDLRFSPTTESGVRVGSGTTIREFATLNRATFPGGFTTVGENCFIMAYAHLAHDVQVGKNVILANNVMLAGHVHVGDHTFVGGGVGVHQFCRIGEGAMIAGLARIALDVPPYAMAAERNEIIGLNLIGLRRRGVLRDSVIQLKAAFRTVYFTPGNIRQIAAARIASSDAHSVEARRFLEFFTTGKRGFARTRREADVVEELD